MNPQTNLPLWNVLFAMARSKQGALNPSGLSDLFKDKKHKFFIYVIIKQTISEFEAQYLIYDIVRKRVTRLNDALFAKKYRALAQSYIITNMNELPESDNYHTLFRPNLKIISNITSILELEWQSKQLAGSNTSAT